MRTALSMTRRQFLKLSGLVASISFVGFNFISKAYGALTETDFLNDRITTVHNCYEEEILSPTYSADYYNRNFDSAVTAYNSL